MPAQTDHLLSNEKLNPDEYLISADGRRRLRYQRDGNLVLYKVQPHGREVAIWASHTAGQRTGHCIMQSDGNLVIYGSGQALWSSGTAGCSNPKLLVQNDGNTVLYSDQGVKWATNTAICVVEDFDFFHNGPEQKLVWLGTAGLIIINEKRREILVIDPWPSYSSLEVPIELGSGPISQLASWLVQKRSEGFKLVGLVVSHEHFDHARDVPLLLLRLLQKGIPVGELPMLVADRGTYQALDLMFTIMPQRMTSGFSDPTLFKQIPFHELKSPTGAPLFYDDALAERFKNAGDTSYPLEAGTELAALSLGHFRVTPYIWDHSTLFYGNVEKDAKSGNYQRATALLIESADGKRTFVLGSAGETNSQYTGGKVRALPAPLQVDVLMTALPHELLDTALFDHSGKLKALVKCQLASITVGTAIVPIHFEDFHVPFPKETVDLAWILLKTPAIAGLIPAVGPLLATPVTWPIALGLVCDWIKDRMPTVATAAGEPGRGRNLDRIARYKSALGTSTSAELLRLNRFLIEYDATALGV